MGRSNRRALASIEPNSVREANSHLRSPVIALYSKKEVRIHQAAHEKLGSAAMVNRGAILRGCAWAALVSACAGIFAPFNPEEPPEYCTAYHHLVKSGGTSLKDQLQRESVRHGLPKPGICTSDGRTTGKMCKDALVESTVIMGYAEELRNSLAANGRECEFFTMMRNPIDRVISAFFYCPKDHDVQANRPSKWCGGSEQEPESINARLLDFTAHMFSNTAYQSLYRSIACNPNFELCPPDHAVTDRPRTLETKKSWEILRHVEEILLTYNAVGIFEYWDLSMQLFDAKVKSPVEKWDASITHNPGVRNEAREELLVWASSSPELHSLLSADLHIYQFAIAIFKSQTRATLGTVWESRL
eukprot:jgi/Undpi1/183/HiC_scaffold_1.g00180.m1